MCGYRCTDTESDADTDTDTGAKVEVVGVEPAAKNGASDAWKIAVGDDNDDN